jgi:hypothetical protein
MTADTPIRTGQLRTLNAMLARLVGTDALLRRDVDAVVRLYEADEQSSRGLDTQGLAEAAGHLLHLLSPDRSVPAIAIRDHRDEPYEPLWAPQKLQHALGQVGDAEDVLLWVVGLQDQYLAGPKARSPKARRVYDEAVESVNALTARISGRRRVTVVVL